MVHIGGGLVFILYGGIDHAIPRHELHHDSVHRVDIVWSSLREGVSLHRRLLQRRHPESQANYTRGLVSPRGINRQYDLLSRVLVRSNEMDFLGAIIPEGPVPVLGPLHCRRFHLGPVRLSIHPQDHAPS